MSMIYKPVEVLENRLIKGNIFSVKVGLDKAAAVPGQFYMFKLDYPLLPRPLSVCEVFDGGLEFCYAVAGQGTEKLSKLKKGDAVQIFGAIGNGFDVGAINQFKKVAILSGGIGIAPFVELVKRLTCEVECFCGFNEYSYLTERLVNVRVATDNGSEGHHGFVTELPDLAKFDLALACGSEPFLRAVAGMCKESGVPSYLSMDKYMACGVGACLVCACKTINGNKRCCVDGPVFLGEELVL